MRGPGGSFVAASSVIFLLYGTVGAVFGAFMIFTSLQAATSDSFPSIWIPSSWTCLQGCDGMTFGFPWGGFLVLGLLVLSMGTVGLACGLWLWRGRVWGAIVGLQLVASGFVLVVSLGAAIRLQYALGFTWPPSNPQLVFGLLAAVNVLMSLLLLQSMKALR